MRTTTKYGVQNYFDLCYLGHSPGQGIMLDDFYGYSYLSVYMADKATQGYQA